MLTKQMKRRSKRTPLAARRVFRLSSCMALSLAIAYGLAVPLPFMAPIFAFILGMKPAPPMQLKALFMLLLLVVLTTSTGLALIPMLLHYPLTGFLVVMVGLFFSNYITVIAGKALVGTFLTVGITLISAAGVASYSLAVIVTQSLALGIAIAAICQWLVYPWFPEDKVIAELPAPNGEQNDNKTTQSNWIAIRATLIIMPAYFIALTNPTMYLAVIMKSVSLSQQGSSLHARDAGRELLGSTFMGGCFAILFWFMLDLVTTLPMFTACMLLFSLYFCSKFYQVIKSNFQPSFWQNTIVTMLILLGPAVEDSANGSDVYAAFAVRMGLFIAVTLYACLAVYLLELIRYRRIISRRKVTACE